MLIFLGHFAFSSNKYKIVVIKFVSHECIFFSSNIFKTLQLIIWQHSAWFLIAQPACASFEKFYFHKATIQCSNLKQKCLKKSYFRCIKYAFDHFNLHLYLCYSLCTKLNSIDGHTYSPCQCVVVSDIHSSTNSGHFSASSPKNTASESSVANLLHTL